MLKNLEYFLFCQFSVIFIDIPCKARLDLSYNLGRGTIYANSDLPQHSFIKMSVEILLDLPFLIILIYLNNNLSCCRAHPLCSSSRYGAKMSATVVQSRQFAVFVSIFSFEFIWRNQEGFYRVQNICKLHSFKDFFQSCTLARSVYREIHRLQRSFVRLTPFLISFQISAANQFLRKSFDVQHI